MTFRVDFLLVGLILSALLVEIRCDSLQNYYLNCSKYSSSTENATIMRLGWSARLHACFEDNPYDLTQPPIPYGYPPIILWYDYSVIYVISFEETRISLMGQLTCGWTDYNRMWDTQQIQIGQITLPISEIWYPQVNFISSVTKRSVKLIEPDAKVILFSTYVTLFSQNVVEGHCNVNYYRFPFDEQNCAIQFQIERYFFFISDLFLYRVNYTFEFERFENEEWSLISVVTLPINITFKEIVVNTSTGYATGEKNEMEKAKVGFEVNLTLRRYPQFYIINILVPIVILTCIGQTAFAIPEHADGKIVVPLTVLLGFMFVQGIVANEMPRSQEAPALGIYVLTCVLLSCANVLCCATCMWIAHITYPMPRAIHISVVVVLRTCLFPAQWFIYIYRCYGRLKRKRSKSKEEETNGEVDVFTTPQVQSIGPSSHTLPVTQPDSGVDSSGSSPANARDQQSSADSANRSEDDEMEQNELKMTSNSSVSSDNDNSKDKEWALAALVVNRIFGILHVAAILTCFFVYVFPLLNGYYTNTYH